MHIQALERRSLFAAVGVDGSFGTDGATQLPGSIDYNQGLAVLGLSDRTYVEQKIGNRFYVQRLTENGAIDTNWGTDGRAEIGFDPTKLVYDKRRDRLYAIGTTATPDGATLAVSRITAGGQLETGYGTDARPGQFVYTLEADERIYAELSVTHALVGADGSLVLGLEKQINDSGDPNSIYAVTSTAEDLLLMKLKPTGSRDTTFGSRGFVTVASGSDKQTVSEFSYEYAFDNVDLADVVPQADGSFRTIVTRDKGVESGSNGGTFVSRGADFSILDRRIRANGTILSGRDKTYGVARNNVGGRERYFNKLFVGAQGDEIVLIGGTTVDGRAGAPVYQTIYTNGTSPFTTALATNDSFKALSVAKQKDGIYYVIGANRIAKLKFGELDPSWNKTGILTTDTAGSFIPDADGRLLRVSAATLVQRLNGRTTSPGAGVPFIKGRTLNVVGTPGDDTIAVGFEAGTAGRLSQIRVTVTTDAGEQAFTFRYNAGYDINIDTGSGNDRVTLTNLRNVTSVATGRGDDVVTGSGSTRGFVGYGLGAGDDSIGLGKDELPRFLDGGAGTDTLRAFYPDRIAADGIEQKTRNRISTP